MLLQRWPVLFLAVIFINLSACGCETNHAESNPENPPNPQESASYMTSLRGMTQKKPLTLIMGEDLILFSDGFNSIEGRLSDNRESYIFQTEHRGHVASCIVDVPLGESINFRCLIDNLPCQYTSQNQGNGTYVESENTCTALVAELSEDSVSLAQLRTQSLRLNLESRCNAFSDNEPALCPNVVERDGEEYHFSESCTDKYDSTSIKTRTNITTDGLNILHVKNVRSSSAREGCFLWWCNGPVGNFHILIMPFNEEYLDDDVFQKMRLAESGGGLQLVNASDRGSSVTYFPSYLSSPPVETPVRGAPVSYHHLLPGAYRGGDDKCEWYEEDVVGSQQVIYDNKAVWDWDDFCACGECSSKLLFVVWESDEGWFDDVIAYGSLDLESTLGKELILSTDDFSITFETKNIDNNLLSKVGALSEDYYERCVELPSPPSMGGAFVEGELHNSDGKVETLRDEAKQVVFYTDQLPNPTSLDIYLLFDKTVDDCTSDFAFLTYFTSKTLKLSVNRNRRNALYVPSSLLYMADELDEQVLNTFYPPVDEMVGNYRVTGYGAYEGLMITDVGMFLADERFPENFQVNPNWNVTIDSFFMPKLDVTGFQTDPWVSGSFTIGFHEPSLIINGESFGQYAGTLNGSFSSDTYCGSLED